MTWQIHHLSEYETERTKVELLRKGGCTYYGYESLRVIFVAGLRDKAIDSQMGWREISNPSQTKLYFVSS